METVDYSYWADYLVEIHTTLGSQDDIALEIAAGNCKLGKYLINQFKKLYLTDISLEMLQYNNSELQTVCCDMLELPFKNEFDFIYSTFDSINYLSTEYKLERLFNQIKFNLIDGGLFLFDVALVNNSKKYVSQLNRSGTHSGISYIQKSEFNSANNIHLNSFKIKLPDGSELKETHEQKIYDFYYYFEVLESEGFVVMECFDIFTFNDATSESDRVQFIVKKEGKC